MLKINNRNPGFHAIALALTLFLALSSCAGPSKISKHGLAFIQLGDSMPEYGLYDYQGHKVTDSEMNEGGYSWRVCTLAYAKGQVLLESDFQDQTRLNRIRVETPELQVKGGLKVGDSLADLLDYTSQWNARPYPAYKLMELTTPKLPRIIFLLRVADFDAWADQEVVSVTDLPGKSEVAGIVIL
jgi:hypothetical protein